MTKRQAAELRRIKEQAAREAAEREARKARRGDLTDRLNAANAMPDSEDSLRALFPTVPSLRDALADEPALALFLVEPWQAGLLTDEFLFGAAAMINYLRLRLDGETPGAALWTETAGLLTRVLAMLQMAQQRQTVAATAADDAAREAQRRLFGPL